MTQPSTPTTTPTTPSAQASGSSTAPNVTFGKNARMYIALDDGSGSEPAFDPTTVGGANSPWAYLCAASQLEIGGKKGSETVNNFCTGGNDVAVNDGSETNTLTIGDATWAENDKAILMLTQAYDTDTRVYYRIFPTGLGAGKTVFRGLLEVNEWKLTIPSKGLIKATNGLNPLGVPERGTVNAAGVFAKTTYTTPTTPATPAAPQPIVSGNLADNVAANLPDTQATQAATYTLTSTAPGDITVVTGGTSANRTVDILDANGNSLATGANGATANAAPAGTYTVRVGGPNASTGGTVMADYQG